MAKSGNVFLVVGVGASAGGLESYLDFFKEIPSKRGMAFVLVQHLSPKYISMLAEIVQKSTQMSVREITDGCSVQPNNIYIIPPNNIVEIFHGVLHLRPLIEAQNTNRLIDTFFSSLATDRKTHAVGIVLSGTGTDGSLGLRDIKAKGGITMVQDPADAKYDGMPKSAIATEIPDHILPIRSLAKALLKIKNRPLSESLLTESPVLSGEEEILLNKIFILLRENTGADFTNYKLPTILRRVNRRMALQRIERLKHYLGFLQITPSEVEALFNDILINVTDFFRDPEAFEALKKSVFPALIKKRPEGATIRVWVPGCSSGEEVYSNAVRLASGYHVCLGIFLSPVLYHP